MNALDGIAVGVCSDEDDRYVAYLAKPSGSLDSFAPSFKSRLPPTGAATMSVEKAGLGMIITPDQIVCDDTNQAERSGMNHVFQQIDGNRIKFLAYVGRLTESVPTGDQLKVSRLELQAHTEGQVVLFSQMSADHIG